MGYNSLLFICNDVADQIAKDPAGWWEKARNALRKIPREGGTFSHGCSANGFQAVSYEHADNHVLVIAGGSMTSIGASATTLIILFVNHMIASAIGGICLNEMASWMPHISVTAL